MGNLEIDDVGKKVKILAAAGHHHHDEIGIIEGRDSMPFPGSRLIWYVKARGKIEVYDEDDLEVLND